MKDIIVYYVVAITVFFITPILLYNKYYKNSIYDLDSNKLYIEVFIKLLSE